MQVLWNNRISYVFYGTQSRVFRPQVCREWKFQELLTVLCSMCWYKFRCAGIARAALYTSKSRIALTKNVWSPNWTLFPLCSAAHVNCPGTKWLRQWPTQQHGNSFVTKLCLNCVPYDRSLFLFPNIYRYVLIMCTLVSRRHQLKPTPSLALTAEARLVFTKL